MIFNPDDAVSDLKARLRDAYHDHKDRLVMARYTTYAVLGWFESRADWKNDESVNKVLDWMHEAAEQAYGEAEEK